jgi:hypothetical protein
MGSAALKEKVIKLRRDCQEPETIAKIFGELKM